MAMACVGVWHGARAMAHDAVALPSLARAFGDRMLVGAAVTPADPEPAAVEPVPVPVAVPVEVAKRPGMFCLRLSS